MSYILLLLNIVATIGSKGIVVFFYVDPVMLPYHNRKLWIAVMTLNFIPQLIHVSSHYFLFEISFSMSGS